MKRRHFLAALLLVACTSADVPRDPVWGKEPCAHCKMLVGDRHYAAQVVFDGDRFFFDDVGCMVLWLEKHAGKPWVHDAATGRWVDARTAAYAPGAATPMDFGWQLDASGHATFAEVRADVLGRERRSSR